MKSVWLSICGLALLLAGCGGAPVTSPPQPPGQTTGNNAAEATQASAPENEDETPEAAEPAGSFPVVDTGQEYCYSNSGSVACPAEGQAFFGQDAQYQGHAIRYQDNGDGTVTDLVTGLVWQQDPGAKTDFYTALDNADGFTLAGYDDWRLPTIKELYSLIDFRGRDASNATEVAGLRPFIDQDHFVFLYGTESGGARIIDSQWISSTVYVSTVMNQQECFFGVNFADGRIKCYETHRVGGSGGYFALHVRGDAYGQNDFVDNGDGTVTDRASGLTWAQDDSGSSLNWEDALAYCEGLSLAGHDDWRLPNAKELQGIVDYSRSPDTTASPALDPVFNATAITNEAGQPDWGFYWASTTHLNSSGGSDTAVYVVFGRGLGYMQEFGGWIDVHGAGAQRADVKTGDPANYPNGHGPQGDAVRIYNFARCVRGGADAAILVGGGTDPNAVISGSGVPGSEGGAPSPPQEAIDACSGLSAGDACSVGPNTGTCANLGGNLACRPEGGP